MGFTYELTYKLNLGRSLSKGRNQPNAMWRECLIVAEWVVESCKHGSGPPTHPVEVSGSHPHADPMPFSSTPGRMISDLRSDGYFSKKDAKEEKSWVCTRASTIMGFQATSKPLISEARSGHQGTYLARFTHG